MNRPDFDEPEGVVVGVVPDGSARAGQPIIEAVADDTGPFTVRRKGDRFVIAPMFLLPFPYGGPEWRRARDEGRIE